MPVLADYEIAPCLENSPISELAREFVDSSRELGTSRGASFLRAWAVAHIFGAVEGILRSPEDPIAAFREVLLRTSGVFKSLSKSGFSMIGPDVAAGGTTGTVEQVTGEHYGHLFKTFSSDAYWRESQELLRTRLTRNGIGMESIRGKSVLDAGCGGGRYTGAWRLLGARPAVGLDISPVNTETARKQMQDSSMTDVRFETGDVLAMPFEDNSFDIVFSNGVLHHTRDWQAGIAEMVRVMKPGGMGWLYLIENPGGLLWDSVELLRVVMHTTSRDIARVSLSVLGIPSNRIFYMLDHVMVPINLRLTPEEIEQQLARSGAVRVRRLTRGADFDRIELLHRGDTYGAAKVGVGENRYVFSKE